MTEVVVAVSGGFDPIHIGHVRMLKKAKAIGNKLVVISRGNAITASRNVTFMKVRLLMKVKLPEMAT